MRVCVYVCMCVCVCVVVCSDGTYYKASFDPDNGGECVRQKYAKFVKAADED